MKYALYVFLTLNAPSEGDVKMYLGDGYTMSECYLNGLEAEQRLSVLVNSTFDRFECVINQEV